MLRQTPFPLLKLHRLLEGKSKLSTPLEAAWGSAEVERRRSWSHIGLGLNPSLAAYYLYVLGQIN